MKWGFLSKIEVATGTKTPYLNGLYSFVEQWTGKSSLTDRTGVFGPGFMAFGTVGSSDNTIAAESTWSQVDKASFSFGTAENHKHVNGFVDVSGGFGLSTGGDVVQENARGANLQSSNIAQPDLLVSFTEKMGCLDGAVTTEEVEGCLLDDDSEPSNIGGVLIGSLAGCTIAIVGLAFIVIYKYRKESVDAGNGKSTNMGAPKKVVLKKSWVKNDELL